jgi:hypothetical protein
LRVLGWTADGDLLAYTRQVEYYPLETIDDETVKPLKLVFGVVREARTGREHAYLLELSDATGATMHRDELAQLPGAGAWKTWLAEHPLAMGLGRFSTYGARAQASGTVKGGGMAALPWSHDQFHFKLPEGEPVKLSLAVAAPDGRVWNSIGAREGTDGLVGWAVPLWSPDARRVAWWMEEDDDNEHGPTQYVVIAAIGPRLEVVVSPDDEDRAWNALERLENAGVPPVFVRRAAAHIGATVIQAAAGSEADAQALAKRLGHATVEPMTAASDFDLTVVAGPELMAPPVSPRRRLGRVVADDDSRTLIGLGIAAGAVLLVWLLTILLARRGRAR